MVAADRAAARCSEPGPHDWAGGWEDEAGGPKGSLSAWAPADGREAARPGGPTAVN